MCKFTVGLILLNNVEGLTFEKAHIILKGITRAEVL